MDASASPKAEEAEAAVFAVLGEAQGDPVGVAARWAWCSRSECSLVAETDREAGKAAAVRMSMSAA